MSNKRIRKKRETKLIRDVSMFAGKIPNQHARVVIEERGVLFRHGDLCLLNCYTGSGRLINTRCMGAKARSPKGRVFVAWKNGKPNLNVEEYKGDALFPNFQQLSN